MIVSRNATLHGKVTVLPMTTDEDNAANKNAIELSTETRAKIDGKRTWVVCDHLMTVATSRLDNVSTTPPRIPYDELATILQKAHSVLAGGNPAPTVTVTSTETTTITETPSVTITEVVEGVEVKVEDSRKG